MKLLHTADLHIGKRVREFSLVEEQEYALGQIIGIAQRLCVDAVLLAGDIFDKAVPSVEALEAFERFLLELSQSGTSIIMVAGNHDSADRLSFGSTFMRESRVIVARAFSEEPQFFDLDDAAGGWVRIHLLPFVRPVHVREAYPDEADAIASYEDAMKVAVAHQPLADDAPNILIAHQFVVDKGSQPETCDSETVSVGGVDGVQAQLFDAFDYVALGHIHGRQSIRRPEVRYSGSIYPYSFSEAGRMKSVTIVDIDQQGRVALRDEPLEPLRTLREVRGSFEEVKAMAAVDTHVEDYMHVILTDDHLMDAMAKVRACYPNVMQLDFDRAMGLRPSHTRENVRAMACKGPLELLDDYYRLQAGCPLSDGQRSFAAQLLEEEGCAL